MFLCFSTLVVFLVFFESVGLRPSDQGLAAGLYQLLVGVVFCEFRVKSTDVHSVMRSVQVGMLMLSMLSCVGLTCTDGTGLDIERWIAFRNQRITRLNGPVPHPAALWQASATSTAEWGGAIDSWKGG